MKNTGKVIEPGETEEREWVCFGNVSSEARVRLPVLSSSLCGDQDVAGPVHVSWETLRREIPTLTFVGRLGCGRSLVNDVGYFP